MKERRSPISRRHRFARIPSGNHERNAARGQSVRHRNRRAVDKFYVEYGTIDDVPLDESQSSVRARSRTDDDKAGLGQEVLDHQRNQCLVFSDENTTALRVRLHRTTLRVLSRRKGNMFAPGSAVRFCTRGKRRGVQLDAHILLRR